MDRRLPTSSIVGVFPAHRFNTGYAWDHTCSPPTRGWTASECDRLLGHRCSPPTRGWTGLLVREFECSPPTGDGPANDGPKSPAHAGMDRPTSRRTSCIGPGVPRPRGDGPIRALSWKRPSFPCSPPTRGWTVSHYPRGTCSEGRVPRPRGDGPNCTEVVRWYVPDQVFPAHAGMDRNVYAWAYEIVRVFPAHAGMDR